jgi:hypothetical protein
MSNNNLLIKLTTSQKYKKFHQVKKIDFIKD